MTVKDFTDSVASIIYDLQEQKKEHPNRFIVSDVVDGEGHQYVDLVQEGGGILGIALVGYIYVLEQMGIRFFSLAGTSAGSINTALLASLGKPSEAKSMKIISILAKKDFFEFIDGGKDVRLFMRSLLSSNPINKWTGGLFGLLTNLDEIFTKNGLNPGLAFREWILNATAHASIGEVRRRMNDFPALHHRQKGSAKPFNKTAKLAIVAADITTETKVVFPEMGELYFAHPDDEKLADIVRASMSVPVFFDPVRIDLQQMRQFRDDFVEKWRELAFYDGEIPDAVLLVDGGIMSNFPIDIFHVMDEMPSHPTFGIKLGVDRKKSRSIGNMATLFMSCFDGARNIRDFEFLKNHEDYKHLVGYINVKDFNWLDFDISDQRKKELFVCGAEAAKSFLERFNWQDYKDMRKRLMPRSFNDGLPKQRDKSKPHRKLGFAKDGIKKRTAKKSEYEVR